MVPTSPPPRALDPLSSKVRNSRVPASSDDREAANAASGDETSPNCIAAMSPSVFAIEVFMVRLSRWSNDRKPNRQGSTRQIEDFDLHDYMASGTVELIRRIDRSDRPVARSLQAETTALSQQHHDRLFRPVKRPPQRLSIFQCPKLTRS